VGRYATTSSERPAASSHLRPLRHARAGELAYTLSRIAPPSVRVVLDYPKNSLIVSGHPAAVEALIGVVD
jgi:hypothetical protein